MDSVQLVLDPQSIIYFAVSISINSLLLLMLIGLIYGLGVDICVFLDNWLRPLLMIMISLAAHLGKYAVCVARYA